MSWGRGFGVGFMGGSGGGVSPVENKGKGSQSFLQSGPMKFTKSDRGQKLNTNLFFLKLFGRRRDIPAKSRDIPLKKFDFPGLEGHTELFGPHPLKWKAPTPT